MNEVSMMQKGGLTIAVMDAICNGHESITHFMHAFDEKLYECLPHVYAICIADNGQTPRKIVGGFFVKTSYHHNDTGFHEALLGVMALSPHLNRFGEDRRYSLLPARVPVEAAEPLSEASMVFVLSQQALKHSTFGHA